MAVYKSPYCLSPSFSPTITTSSLSAHILLFPKYGGHFCPYRSFLHSFGTHSCHRREPHFYRFNGKSEWDSILYSWLTLLLYPATPVSHFEGQEERFWRPRACYDCRYELGDVQPCRFVSECKGLRREG